MEESILLWILITADSAVLPPFYKILDFYYFLFLLNTGKTAESAVINITRWTPPIKINSIH